MDNSSYQDFKEHWGGQDQASAYRSKRFKTSKKWRWIDVQEQRIVGDYLSGLGPSSRVLDIPCGEGRMNGLFGPRGVEYFGSDISLPMLKLVKGSFQSRRLFRADALRLPFRDSSFQGLISIRLLHRIREKDIRVGMLREMGRIVDGSFMVTYYTKWNTKGVKRMLQGKYPGLSLAEVRGDIAAAGLKLKAAIPVRRLTNQQWFFIIGR
jgi:ubiquinone/menaquinone biosynthesis C-methylase UbiE